jgi:Ca-activated chloride channel family protein
MRLSFPISISLLLLTLRAMGAQTADDFFNSGAQLYISDKIPPALEKVESGLKIYPDDARLKKLEALLKKQQSQNSQSQQNQNQQQQSQQQQNKQQSQQQKSNGGQNQQQQDKQSSQKGSQDQQKQGEQKQNEAAQKKGEQGQQNSSAPKMAPTKSDQNTGGQPVAPGQMTPEEAKRLLDAQKGDEQILKMKPMEKPPDSRRPVKDW